MVTDPIADFLTRIRNGIMANKRIVEVPSSNVKKAMTKILYDKGYIQGYKFEEADLKKSIKIALKFNPATRASAITHIQRVSTPGLRQYVKATELPRILNGLGIAIISTSKGLMTDKEARTENIGGEVLCYVY